MNEGGNITANFTLTADEDEEQLARVKNISYKNRILYLMITPTIVDASGHAIENALVSINVYLNDDLYYSGSGRTGSKGTVSLKLTGPSAGTYKTVIEDVEADGYLFDGITPNNSYTLIGKFFR